MVTLPLAEDRYRANAVGQIHNGDVLAVAGSRGFGPADVDTVIRDTLRFYRYTAEGSIAGLLTVMPGAERWGLSVGGMITFPYVPFSADPVWATGSDGFYIAPGGTAEIRVWSSAGVLARIIRWHRPVQPVTAESKETLRQRLIRSARDANARRRQETFLAPTASHLPLFTPCWLMTMTTCGSKFTRSRKARSRPGT